MKFKRMIATAAVVLGILALLGVAVGQLFLNQWHRFEPIPTDPAQGIAQMIRAQGYTAEAAEAVRKLQLPERIKYAYVAEGFGDRRILAATLPELEGRSEGELMDSLIDRRLQGVAIIIQAPDGRAYRVGSATTAPVLPQRVGVPAFLTGLITAALAWLALATWIYLDARERGRAAAAGWGLLGILAAPLTLAVWLISRRGEESVTAPPLCPGCGADTVRGAAFCVRCGHALRPACPGCRRPVEIDWSYCGTCGAPLTDS